MDLLKVKFIKSPVGKYKMAYNVGHSGLVRKELADKLIKEGYAVLVESTKVETKTNTEAETATNTAKKRTTRKIK
jgi:hypothetical protein